MAENDAPTTREQAPPSAEEVDTGLPVHTEAEALDPDLPMPRGDEVVAALEAILFATTQPLNVRRLSVLMNGVPETEVRDAMAALHERYSQPASGLVLMEVAGGWQVATRPEVADWVMRLHKHRRRGGLSASLLETLAIVAYKQPITRADIEAIRGVDCSAAIRSLQDAGLVEVVGRKETVGRPPLYGTTEGFLKTFGLNDLEQLPSVGELRSVLEAPMQGGEPAPSEEPAPGPPSPADDNTG